MSARFRCVGLVEETKGVKKKDEVRSKKDEKRAVGSCSQPFLLGLFLNYDL
jgi:hypothetical protein